MTRAMLEEQKVSTRKSTSTTSNDAKRISEKLDLGDVKGAVRLASSFDTFSIPDETNLKLLQDKHPDCPENRRPFPSIDNEADTFTVNSDLVKDLINSFPNGSGAGPSSLRAKHLKIATEKRAENSLIILANYATSSSATKFQKASNHCCLVQISYRWKKKFVA